MAEYEPKFPITLINVRVMDYYGLTDKQIAHILGARLRALRLRQNRSQSDVAKAAGLGERTLQILEEGKGKLENFVAVLRELQALDGLDAFLPEPQVSPLELAKRDGKIRRRASRKSQSDVHDAGRKGGDTW